MRRIERKLGRHPAHFSCLVEGEFWLLQGCIPKIPATDVISELMVNTPDDSVLSSYLFRVRSYNSSTAI